VLTVSIHEGPQTLFPGTGDASETGGPGAEGSSVNIALPPGTSDAGWLRAFHAVVPHVLRAFGPEIILSQHGCDSHMEDPLTNLRLSIDGQRASYLTIERLVGELTGGRWIITGGGGYALTSVVPRIWTHLLAIASGSRIDPETDTPAQWRSTVEEMTGRQAPQQMTEGRSTEYREWGLGHDPSNWLDRSIQESRQATFPLLGIDMSV
jgi:acetoin utilization protein AcuC